MATSDLTAARLRELLHYDESTGLFTRIATDNKWQKLGLACGQRMSNPLEYSRIRIDGAPYKAHRLVWLYVTGVWPTQFVDHINGNKQDNRFSNLRDVSRKVNGQNRRSAQCNSKTGLLGVQKRRNRWAATIIIDKTRLWIGTFDTPDAAHAAYLAAKRRLHDGCQI